MHVAGHAATIDHCGEGMQQLVCPLHLDALQVLLREVVTRGWMCEEEGVMRITRGMLLGLQAAVGRTPSASCSFTAAAAARSSEPPPPAAAAVRTQDGCCQLFAFRLGQHGNEAAGLCTHRAARSATCGYDHPCVAAHGSQHTHLEQHIKVPEAALHIVAGGHLCEPHPCEDLPELCTHLQRQKCGDAARRMSLNTCVGSARARACRQLSQAQL